ncbi:hypothetical protein ACFOOK_28405 [Micromonospora krabiensis]|uniref:Secreted protein n=1 Tax=Micromonospora krabiensis TaxID=307121 RepID=A0A1C3N4K1_9ACTN|nr:hypothetical protein [Micromonospora krabiensis]SBV27511.1 hypothetical protein GA0070620_3030 [Micromonospora krabiensis]
MFDVLLFLMVVGCVAAIAGGLGWLGSRARRRGVGGEVMGPFEEMWHPAAHRYRAEVRQHEQHEAPRPSADDDDGPTSRR